MSATLPEPEPERVRSPYIGGPIYDSVLFVGAPVLCIGLIWIFWNTGMVRENGGNRVASFYLNTLLTGHLLVTLVRSHGNQTLFKQFPLRFTAAPIGMYIALLVFPKFRFFMNVVLNFWGHWHAFQQTFGLARIYDTKVGNPPAEGRTLDFWLNVVLWMGPLLAGATYYGQAQLLGEDLAPLFPGMKQSVPAYAALYSPWMTRVVVAGSIAFVAYYIYQYRLLYKAGHGVSRMKVGLLVCTGLALILGHGFNPGHQGRFLTVVFHYWQYFAIVWIVEGANLTRLFRLDGFRAGRWITLAIFLTIPIAVGMWLSSHSMDAPWRQSGVMLLSLMHFWYDGFVWSVRKKMV